MHIRIVYDRVQEKYNISIHNGKLAQAIQSYQNKDDARKYADMVADVLECGIFEGPEGYTNIVRRAK
jgi:lauroyl/myristoyl acyltransferase